MCAGRRRHRRLLAGRSGESTRPPGPAHRSALARYRAPSGTANGDRGASARASEAPDFIDLAVVGEGTLAPALRRLADELGLGDRARFVGLVSEQDLVDWYRAADAFVLPTIAYEASASSPWKALACGTPVVRTPVGATPELLMPLDPRLVTAGADEEALARAVDAALAFADPELQARCRRYALERFSWEPVVDQWEASFDEASRTQP